MPSTLSRFLRLALTASLGVTTLSSAIAADTTKLSKEKQDELNKLIAEAVKQAGIELDDEELTIVIVKKPGKDTDTSDNDETSTLVIGDTASEGTISNQVSDEAVAQKEVPVSQQENIITVQTQEPSNESSSQIKQEKFVSSSEVTTEKPDKVATASSEPSNKSDDSEPPLVVAPAVIEESNKAQLTTSSETPALSKPSASQETLTTNISDPIESENIANINDESTKPESKELLSDTLKPSNSVSEPSSPNDIATLQSNTERTSEQSIEATAPETTVKDTSTFNDEYYGNYIPPQKRMDTYYSSDIMEAINAKNTSSTDLQALEGQVASLNLSMMASDEMSDLVVEGALDSTAAGGVSTTTLKTAVVVPDAGEIEDLDKGPDDQDSEELKEALNKRDLNKRVKEALELLSQSKNRGNSTGTASAGTLTATNINVTATIDSRQTQNALSTHRSNLRNSNF
ncbi:hypothetical protein ACFOEK_01565 [Litoribrevibacter euphylliae]|uniref:Uncharacterized protein n=1 Tax=Litoribrevibacter euphylliae TaxID=1834034 RepID=A0ABV7HAK6_9GAMM